MTTTTPPPRRHRPAVPAHETTVIDDEAIASPFPLHGIGSLRPIKKICTAAMLRAQPWARQATAHLTMNRVQPLLRSFASSSRLFAPSTRRTSPPPPPPPPWSHRYPPPQDVPETILYDQPAVANPIETQRALKNFKTQSKKAAAGLTLFAIITAVGIYLYDYPSSLLAEAGVQQAQPLQLKGLNELPDEMERKVRKAKKELEDSSAFALLAFQRSTVIAKAVALCVWDYRKTLNSSHASSSDSNEALRQCHMRSAHRILEALQTNGGLYIKLGQHISSVILLPVEWTNTLKPLQDQNRPTPLYELEAMFRSETGWSFADAFSEIDEKPLGVASLAQVHKARDRTTGQWLAIKLMHPQVERFSNIDMKTVNYLVGWVKRVFPQFEFTWLAEEMNANMPLEMDFRHEAENARRAEKDFARYRKTSVYFPKVPWSFKRAMALEFIDGRRPDDLAYLAEHKIDRNIASQELSRIFAQMLYLHGFFHADPHGGNVLIRPAQKSSRSPHNFEVVLLDHGLYFDIDQNLRTDYARFWLSLMSRSTPKVMAKRRKLAKQIAHIDDDLYPILESAITGRSGLEGSDPRNPHGVKGKKRASSILDMETGTSMSDDETEHIRKTVMEKEGLFLDILEVLRRVPRRMLMVLKLNDLTRSLDASLYTTHGPTRPFIIAARYCALAVWGDDKAKLGVRRKTEGLTFGLLRDWLCCWGNYLWFYRGLAFLESLSNIRARTSKVLVFTDAVLRGQGFRSASYKASGLEEQERRRQKEKRDQVNAKEAVQKESAVVQRL